ncbi:MAG: hypothetical protein IJU03_10320 [Thermoguttaceae bacterium]|nr:hypothetical protein [Thermoguttaceae bacterium]
MTLEQKITTEKKALLRELKDNKAILEEIIERLENGEYMTSISRYAKALSEYLEGCAENAQHISELLAE